MRTFDRPWDKTCVFCTGAVTTCQPWTAGVPENTTGFSTWIKLKISSCCVSLCMVAGLCSFQDFSSWDSHSKRWRRDAVTGLAPTSWGTSSRTRILRNKPGKYRERLACCEAYSFGIVCIWIYSGKNCLTAFAGNARSMTALKPLYREATPSSLISSLRTSRKPLGYFPSGAERQVQQQKLRQENQGHPD